MVDILLFIFKYSRIEPNKKHHDAIVVEPNKDAGYVKGVNLKNENGRWVPLQNRAKSFLGE